MADPGTIIKIAHAVIQQLKDEENRRRLLVLLLLPIVTVVLIIASPVAIFFAVVGNPVSPGENEPSIVVIMYELEQELLGKVESEKNTGDYDELIVIYEGSEDNEPIINIQDVIAVYSILSDMKGLEGDPEAVARLTPKQVELLKKTFWEMNEITVEWREREEPYDGPTLYDEDGNELPDPPPRIIKIKVIKINSLSYTEVIDDYGFNEDEQDVLHELMDAKYAELFIGMLGAAGQGDINGGGLGGSHDLGLVDLGGPDDGELQSIRDSLPSDLSDAQADLIAAALSLVGRVKYFWAGKSTAIGWDDRWGEMREVTGEGSETTGTTRPYGMDCSGYVQWAFVNAGVPAGSVGDVIGSSTRAQWEKSSPTTLQDLKIGDLAFQAIPGTTKTNHVGIVVGFDANGDPEIAHCSSSKNGVVVTGLGKTFKYFRRPAIFD